MYLCSTAYMAAESSCNTLINKILLSYFICITYRKQFFFAWNALIIYAIICIQIIIWDRMKNVLHGLSYQKQEHIMPLAETTRTCTCKYATVNNNSKIKLLVSTFFSSSLSGWNPGFVTPLPFSWISIFSDIIKSTPAS